MLAVIRLCAAVFLAALLAGCVGLDYDPQLKTSDLQEVTGLAPVYRVVGTRSGDGEFYRINPVSPGVFEMFSFTSNKTLAVHDRLHLYALRSDRSDRFLGLMTDRDYDAAIFVRFQRNEDGSWTSTEASFGEIPDGAAIAAIAERHGVKIVAAPSSATMVQSGTISAVVAFLEEAEDIGLLTYEWPTQFLPFDYKQRHAWVDEVDFGRRPPLTVVAADNGSVAPVQELAARAVTAVPGLDVVVPSGRKLALVIGNDNYSLGLDEDAADQGFANLDKAVTDARSFADLMTAKGYEVTFLSDQTTQQMTLGISRFIRQIQPGDGAVFYYSGHGWSDGKQNFLVGVGTEAQSEIGDLEMLSLPVQNGANGVVDRLEASGAELRVVFLDACRNNPFLATKGSRAGPASGGLVPVRAEGTFVVFSAGTGQEALDTLGGSDSHPNGVFTRVLLPLLEADWPLLDAVKAAQVQTRNLARTVDHEQLPAYYDGVVGTVCLDEACVARLSAAAQ